MNFQNIVICGIGDHFRTGERCQIQTGEAKDKDVLVA